MTIRRTLKNANKFLQNFGRNRSDHVHVQPATTALFELHKKKGGKIVDFGGFLLPVVYNDQSISSSHLHTRQHCSLFDVSHMLQVIIRGRHRVELIESLTTADVGNLPSGKSTLSVMTHPETGGILDDLMITSTAEEYLYVVSNAARREHDSKKLLEAESILKKKGKDVTVELLDPEEQSLLALQGPKAAAVLQRFCPVDLSVLPFMHSILTEIYDIPNCRITRCGYTGEDGFEISLKSDCVEQLVELLIDAETNVRLAGLGARDSLRLEAALCLYGSDMDEKITPVEASLSWLVAKKRREKKDFPGANIILKQLADGITRKRIGLKINQGPPARHGTAILDASGKKIGSVTSGGPAPSLGYHIAMGYVQVPYHRLGTNVLVDVRGKQHSATVVSMPFVPTQYYKKF